MHAGDNRIADLLIEKGAEINAPDDLGDVPLLLAVKNGNCNNTK